MPSEHDLHNLCAVLEVWRDPRARPVCPHPNLWSKGVPCMVATLRAIADTLLVIARSLEIGQRVYEAQREREAKRNAGPDVGVD